MNRLPRMPLAKVLLAVLVAELLAGTALVLWQPPQPVPPLPPVEIFDPLTAEQMRQMRDGVRPRAAEDWSELAEMYLAHGFYPEAEACYRRACELSPEHAERRGDWAFCLSRMGRIEEALAEFQQAIALGHPDAAALRYFAGRDWLRLEQTEAAKRTFLLAADLPAARYELARLDLAEGRGGRAAERLERLQREIPDCLAPHWLRARAERRLGNAREAEEYERRAAAARGRLPTPFDERSERVRQVYHQFGRQGRLEQLRQEIERGRLAEARRELEWLLQQQWSAEAADLLSDVDHAEGRFDQARRRLGEVLDREGPSLHWLWRYGEACEAAGELDEAGRVWLRAVALGPESEAQGLFVKLSQLYESRGDVDEARRFKARFYHAAGVERLDSGQPGAARASLEESLALDAERAATWYYLGQALEALDRTADARRAYGRCLELQAFHGRALDALRRIGP
ncbi:MAG: tetratricopeptide repeat protein [Pirellulaceae bacterium]|nr:tetratricopeptide repeat protein [Pirellulaceae bacterium]